MKDQGRDSGIPHALGRYEIVEEIGRGGMGVVYKAKDPAIGRSVVVKVFELLGADPTEIAQLRERFRREAATAGMLSHPGIVTIHDVGHDPAAGVDFIAMELVEGASLQQVAGSGVAFGVPQVLSDMTQVADALDYAHAQGVVHRDVKPGNILVRSDGRLKVADFGIARLAESNLTRAGQVLGSPSYISPEQVTGREVDGRSDQFSLAVVVYRLLTGKLPFVGENVSTIFYKVANEDPVPPAEIRRDLPQAVSAALMKALSKEPAQRYGSCREMLDALTAAYASAPKAGTAPDAARPAPSPAPPPPAQRSLAGDVELRRPIAEPPTTVAARRTKGSSGAGAAAAALVVVGVGVAAAFVMFLQLTPRPGAVVPRTEPSGAPTSPGTPSALGTATPRATAPPATASPSVPRSASASPASPATARETTPAPTAATPSPAERPSEAAAPRETRAAPAPSPRGTPDDELPAMPSGVPAPASTPAPEPDEPQEPGIPEVSDVPEVADVSGLLTAGQEAFDAGRHEEARRIFEQARSLDPENATAGVYRGLVDRELAKRKTELEASRMPQPGPPGAPVSVVVVPKPGERDSDSRPLTNAVLIVAIDERLERGKIEVFFGAEKAVDETFEKEPRDIARVHLPGLGDDGTLRTSRRFPLGLTAGEHEVTVRIVSPGDQLDVTGAGLVEVAAGQVCRLDVAAGGGKLLMRIRCD